jgi:SAM-dependent methyltransferase
MQNDMLIKKWSADLYDQYETQINDIDFMLSVIGNSPQNILEVCCGSGRILVPLAKASHNVTGFDMDLAMMSKIADKAKDLDNIHWYSANAVTDDWGTNYDVVVLAGNILINIVSTMAYQDAQKLFIQKAYNSLKIGGHIYLDFNLFLHPEKIFGTSKERIIFDGTDHDGNYGTMRLLNETYCSSTQILTATRLTQVHTQDGENIIQQENVIKYIPNLDQVIAWLKDCGFAIKQVYGDYSGHPISEKTSKAIIWAQKMEVDINDYH